MAPDAGTQISVANRAPRHRAAAAVAQRDPAHDMAIWGGDAGWPDGTFGIAGSPVVVGTDIVALAISAALT